MAGAEVFGALIGAVGVVAAAVAPVLISNRNQHRKLDAINEAVNHHESRDTRPMVQIMETLEQEVQHPRHGLAALRSFQQQHHDWHTRRGDDVPEVSPGGE